MTVVINERMFYRTKEACKKAGISRATWFRWVSENVIEDVKHRDRKGWRLFTEEDIEKIKAVVNTVVVESSSEKG